MSINYAEITVLVKRIKSGDNIAFARLYELTYQKIYFICFSILKDQHDAQDAVQETYIKIFSAISSLEDDKLFIAWANKITYSICIRMLKKKKPTLVDDDFLLAVPDENEDRNPEAAFVKKNDAEQLLKIIDNLDPILRTTLIFKYFDNLKIAQIAYVMDCPEGTVKSRLNTAKRLLKTALQKKAKGDIMLGAFTYLPLREALAYSAQHTSMDSSSAMEVFHSITNECGNPENLNFTPQKAAMPYTKTSTMALKAMAIIGVSSGVLFGATWALANPEFIDIQMQQISGDYTNQDLKIEATIKVPVCGIKETYAILTDSNQKIHGIWQDKDTISYTVRDNGTYSLFAISGNKKIANAQIEVSCIDKEGPFVKNNRYTKDILTLEVGDSLSGIDFSSIYGKTKKGILLYPLQINEDSSTITFDFPTEDFRLYMKDMAGNESTHWVVLVEN